MGVVNYGSCSSCGGRSGYGYDGSQYECSYCQQRQEVKKVKLLTQQSLWVRFLYWLRT